MSCYNTIPCVYFDFHITGLVLSILIARAIRRLRHSLKVGAASVFMTTSVLFLSSVEDQCDNKASYLGVTKYASDERQ